jgi:hypothetical protein
MRSLSFDQASLLAEAASEEVALAGRVCDLSVFRQQVAEDAVLVVVQIARRGIFSAISYHSERGLVFEHGGNVREASSHELLASGG